MHEPEFSPHEDALDLARVEEMEGEEPYEEQFVAPEGFAVSDEASANWLVRKVLELRARSERMKATKRAADTEIKSAQKSETFLLERFGT